MQALSESQIGSIPSSGWILSNSSSSRASIDVLSSRCICHLEELLRRGLKLGFMRLWQGLADPESFSPAGQ